MISKTISLLATVTIAMAVLACEREESLSPIYGRIPFVHNLPIRHLNNDKTMKYVDVAEGEWESVEVDGTYFYVGSAKDKPARISLKEKISGKTKNLVFDVYKTPHDALMVHYGDSVKLMMEVRKASAEGDDGDPRDTIERKYRVTVHTGYASSTRVSTSIIVDGASTSYPAEGQKPKTLGFTVMPGSKARIGNFRWDVWQL